MFHTLDFRRRGIGRLGPASWFHAAQTEEEAASLMALSCAGDSSIAGVI